MAPSNSTAFPAERIQLGHVPGPAPQRVLRALGAPTFGHLEPQYLAIMDEACARLRAVFRTKNALAIPVQRHRQATVAFSQVRCRASAHRGPAATRAGAWAAPAPCR